MTARRKFWQELEHESPFIITLLIANIPRNQIWKEADAAERLAEAARDVVAIAKMNKGHQDSPSPKALYRKPITPLEVYVNCKVTGNNVQSNQISDQIVVWADKSGTETGEWTTYLQKGNPDSRP